LNSNIIYLFLKIAEILHDMEINQLILIEFQNKLNERTSS